MTPVRRAAVALALMLAAPGPPSWSQDFSPAAAAGPSSSAAALLERALPAAGGGRLEALTTSWLGVPGLVTRAVCVAAAARSVRAAAGWSQTGEDGDGWAAAGLAVGATAASGGCALRAVARRDLAAGLDPSERLGAELGGGAWLRAGPGVRVWASAPQLVTAGAAPPLARALTTGIALERGGLGLWFEHAAPARDDDESGVRAAGVTWRLDPARVWVEGRDHPLRAGFGLALGTLAVRVLEHPRLGDTVTLALSLPPRAAAP